MAFSSLLDADERMAASGVNGVIINRKPIPHSPDTQPMRLTTSQAKLIRDTAHDLFGDGVRVVLFGSRLDDTAHGGDVDLMLEIRQPVENPALMVARMAAKVSRAMRGRKVDVVLSAPNLRRLPIHEIASREGQVL
ncbi:MAG: nucleotidyltransferase domain-containing protein [Thiobacillaceae bacterium]|jgi:hypothetical protein|nr:nucleotidyltransferase domain-containing protein [Thiobacillaceae bacterium]